MKTYLFILLNFLCFSLSAQNVFKGSVFSGFTTAQLGGDSISGYDKLGITAGLKLSYRLSGRLELNMDLGYVQKGSRESLGFGNSSDATTLNYIQLPIYLTVNDWYVEKEDYYKVGAFFGFSYGYLISVSTTNNILRGQENLFNKSDLGARIGCFYSFSKRLTLRIFYTDSFLNVLESSDLFRTNALDSFYWTFRTEYNF